MMVAKLKFPGTDTVHAKSPGVKTRIFMLFILFSTGLADAYPGGLSSCLVASNDSEGSKPLIRLVAGYEEDTLSFDPFVIYYDDLATHNFDGQYDALKLFNTDINVTNYYIFSADNRGLSISGIPFSDSICSFNLGLKTEKQGNVVFGIRDIDASLSYKRIVIRDLHTGYVQEISNNKQYSIYLDAGHYTDRFVLSIEDAATGIGDLTLSNDIFRAFVSAGKLKIDIADSQRSGGTLRIYCLKGIIQYRKEFYYPGQYELDTAFSRGVYIINFVSEGRAWSRKLYINTR